MGFENIDMKVLTTKLQIINEMKKGNQYIVFADVELYPERNTVRIMTQDIIYYDKKSKRYRFMLGSLVTEDLIYIYPVRSFMARGGLKEFDVMCSFTGLDINNYDKIFSVNKKYIVVQNDLYKNSPINF